MTRPTLRENVKGLHDRMAEYLTRGYVAAPDFVEKLVDTLQGYLDSDTLVQIGDCVLNDACVLGLDHEGDCEVNESLEQRLRFYSDGGETRVNIEKNLNEPARCTVVHRGHMVFVGRDLSADVRVPGTPQPGFEGDTRGEGSSKQP